MSINYRLVACHTQAVSAKAKRPEMSQALAWLILAIPLLITMMLGMTPDRPPTASAMAILEPADYEADWPFTGEPVILRCERRGPRSTRLVAGFGTHDYYVTNFQPGVTALPNGVSGGKYNQTYATADVIKPGYSVDRAFLELKRRAQLICPP